MNEHIKEYLFDIMDLDLESTEHQKRSSLEKLFKAFAPISANVKHEPTRDKSEKRAGAPDFIITQDSLVLGYVENKRVNIDLDKVAKDIQIEKYLTLSDNILLCDYLRFCLIRPDDKGKAKIIAEARLCSYSELKEFSKNNALMPNEQNAKVLEELLRVFFSFAPAPIISSIEFADSLAMRTRLLKDFLCELQSPEVLSIYETFRQRLYKDLDFKEFCDSFAQTLTYSLFLAKLNNSKNQSLSLYSVKGIIPKSFPLIRELSGFLENLDNLGSIRWLLEEILTIIDHIDINRIISELNEISDKDLLGVLHKDPYLHFYETFLSKYDPKLRKARGVYYTPASVVHFIINAVDDVLKKDFNQAKGLTQALKKDSSITLLDFATGTGTFLLEAFRKALGNEPMNSTDFKVERLIERFYGFEFLIAPYVIAHLKLFQTLKEEFGYEIGKSDEHERLKIYLTNTLINIPLEEDKGQKNLPIAEFALAKEFEDAQKTKNSPILVVTGNPPYNGSSVNAYEKIKDYSYCEINENGNLIPIKEQNTRWIQDDYVKFIRFAEDKIEKQDSGMVAIITNHSFLDNPTFRGMRWHLLNTFDKMYILDLHGNSKKKEKTLDGKADQNVFDIQQGVSISIFIKSPKKDREENALKFSNTPKCEVLHYDLYGNRKSKNNFLFDNDLESISWQVLQPKNPFYLFIPQDEAIKEEYEKGYSVKDIFRISSTGICSQRDEVVFHKTKESACELIANFCKMEKDELIRKYNIAKDGQDWQIQRAMDSVRRSEKNQTGCIVECLYRPFDMRWTYFNGESRAFMARPRTEVMEHLIGEGKNKALMVSRQSQAIGENEIDSMFISDKIVDLNFYRRGGEQVMPLYIKNTPNALKTLKKSASKEEDSHLFTQDKEFNSDPFGGKDRIENFTPEFRKFIDEKYGEHFNPEEILGYIYAVLYHREYRKKYLGFLKIDYPRIPFVSSKEEFKKLSELGQKLIDAHLMQGQLKEEIGKSFFMDIKNRNEKIQKVLYEEKSQRIFVNESLYFENVSIEIWEYKIGGYQVLDKYLKSHKDEVLDIEHFAHVIRALHQTLQIEDEIANCKIV